MTEPMTHDEIIEPWLTRTRDAIGKMRAVSEPMLQTELRNEEQQTDTLEKRQWNRIARVVGHASFHVSYLFNLINNHPERRIGPNKDYADYREAMQTIISRCEVSQRALVRLQKNVPSLVPESDIRPLMNRLSVVKNLTNYALNRIGGSKSEFALRLTLEQVWSDTGTYHERNEAVRVLSQYIQQNSPAPEGIDKDIHAIADFDDLIKSPTTAAEKKGAFEAKREELRAIATQWGFDIDTPKHSEAFALIREKIDLAIEICDGHIRGRGR